MAYPGKSKYSLLNSSDAALNSVPTSAHKSSLLLISFLLQTATFISSLTLLVIFLFSPRALSSALSSPSTVLPVGISRVNPSEAHQLQPYRIDAATARANGCIFDLLTLAWLAPECYDADLSAKFLEDAPETFYYNEVAQHSIESYEALSERPLGELSWKTRKYHIYHCSYGWRLMHRALERGGMVESGLSSYHHTEHCTGTSMNTSVPMDAVITRMEISYPDC